MREDMISTWIEFMRLRISMDVSKPLCTKINIKKRDGSQAHLLEAYEHLLNVYYFCGLISHTDKQCDTLVELEERGFQISEFYCMLYSSFIKIDPRGVRNDRKQNTNLQNI